MISQIMVSNNQQINVFTQLLCPSEDYKSSLLDELRPKYILLLRMSQIHDMKH